MTQRSIPHQIRRLVRRNRLAQIALVASFWLVGEAVTRRPEYRCRAPSSASRWRWAC